MSHEFQVGDLVQLKQNLSQTELKDLLQNTTVGVSFYDYNRKCKYHGIKICTITFIRCRGYIELDGIAFGHAPQLWEYVGRI